MSSHPRSAAAKSSPAPDRRIEVTRLIEEGGASRVLIQDMSYGSGVGWFAQKTIELDGEQVEALLKKLCCAHSAETSRSRRDRGVSETLSCSGASGGGQPAAATPVEPVNLVAERDRARVIDFPG